jgi:hypothetical protein
MMQNDTIYHGSEVFSNVSGYQAEGSSPCIVISMKTILSRPIPQIAALLLLVLSCTASAQSIDTIKANPEAKPLRKIWQVTGGEFGGGRVGEGFGSVGDINQDGLEDWAVNWGADGVWRIYYGSDDSLSTTPVAVVDTFGAVPKYPIVGDFWGTGHKAIGFSRGSYELWLFRTDSLRLDTQAAAVVDPHKMSVYTTISPKEIVAADLDNDGDDELILFTSGTIRNGNISRKPEVWIYQGGQDFQVDEPTLILQDDEESNGGQFMLIGHWNNDRKLDLLTVSKYTGDVNKLKLIFGSEGSPWNWNQPEEHVVPFGGFLSLDCDGDGILDMATGGIDYRVSLFLSGSGKDIRLRTFTSDDVDRTYRSPYYYCYPYRVGYLNDSARRYEMLDIRIEGIDYFFSGGLGGPDGYYDMYGAVVGHLRSIGDVNGDGWDDLIGGNYAVNFEAGIAAIYAGGPYIPRDPSLGVRAIAGEGYIDAINTWPNPVTTQLHIAWRGDLKRIPRRFSIHNLLGQLIAQGEVESWRGEALWQCSDAPAGVYILSIQDYRGELIATTPVVKY